MWGWSWFSVLSLSFSISQVWGLLTYLCYLISLGLECGFYPLGFLFPCMFFGLMSLGPRFWFLCYLSLGFDFSMFFLLLCFRPEITRQLQPAQPTTRTFSWLWVHFLFTQSNWVGLCSTKNLTRPDSWTTLNRE